MATSIFDNDEIKQNVESRLVIKHRDDRTFWNDEARWLRSVPHVTQWLWMDEAFKSGRTQYVAELRAAGYPMPPFIIDSAVCSLSPTLMRWCLKEYPKNRNAWMHIIRTTRGTLEDVRRDLHGAHEIFLIHRKMYPERRPLMVHCIAAIRLFDERETNPVVAFCLERLRIPHPHKAVRLQDQYVKYAQEQEVSAEALQWVRDLPVLE